MTRFPTYPKDILNRADALLSEKYPDGIVDPRFVEIACEAMMMEQERCRANVVAYKDYDGSTGDEYDRGYTEAHHDALAAVGGAPIGRYPLKVWALAERVWAEMLTVKHPADEFQKIRDIEEIAMAIQHGAPSSPSPGTTE